MVERERLYAETRVPRSIMRDIKTLLCNATVQLLYLLICQYGGIRMDAFAAADRTFSDGDALWTQLSDTALLARLRLRQDSGQANYVIEGSCVVETFSDTYKIALETQENSHQVEERFRNTDSALDEPELYAIQKAVLGFSIPECSALIGANFRQIRALTEVQDFGPIVAARLDALPSSAQTVLGAFTLTLRSPSIGPAIILATRQPGRTGRDFSCSQSRRGPPRSPICWSAALP